MANALEQAILQSLFKVNPTLRETRFDIFNPEGQGYDYQSATTYGLSPDETGHWGSRAELPETEARALGLPVGSGIILKGISHPTFSKTIEGENQAGFDIIKGPGGRYFSVPKTRP